MLSRTSTIRHRGSGVALETPLLIPSFSSKGFKRAKRDGKSEIPELLATAGEFITESFLISAYDIFHGHLPAPSDLPASADLIFLDSGGYEISTDSDYCSVIDPIPAPAPWDESKLRSVLDSWPEEKPLVVVSYDHHEDRKSVPDQVAAARKLAAAYPSHLHCLLIKPETSAQETLEAALRAVMANATDLSTFDIVGITEKELGNSMITRMTRIARLRHAMDEAGVRVPIHVFGALDPVSVCLYFLSGAEIFDGLTWLRYGYLNGQCVYRHNLGVFKYTLHATEDAIKSRAMADNYYQLQELEHRMREFVATENFNKLEPHAVLLKEAQDSLIAKLKRS